jgi:ribosome-associated translation inhibitor RaiA
METHIEATGTTHTEIQGRGVALTRPVRQLIEARLREYRRQFPGFVRGATVRLFTLADAGRGLDQACLVCVPLAPRGELVVASDVNGDVRRAIHCAFRKLEDATRRALHRESRRVSRPSVVPSLRPLVKPFYAATAAPASAG